MSGERAHPSQPRYYANRPSISIRPLAIDPDRALVVGHPRRVISAVLVAAEISALLPIQDVAGWSIPAADIDALVAAAELADCRVHVERPDAEGEG